MKWPKFFHKTPAPCKHPGLVERKWIDADGTQMVYVRCPDCGFLDSGHVYANPETWLQP